MTEQAIECVPNVRKNISSGEDAFEFEPDEQWAWHEFEAMRQQQYVGESYVHL